jgi:predicted O-linked N-acetylglucosamine transferase (SPINDLY family)
MNDDALTALIRKDRIDILVDLNGHMGLHRLGVFMLKPAPVQASWLDYPETIGLSAIDYVITDPITVPPGYEKYFVEEVVRLPGGRFTHQPPDFAPPVVPPPCLTRGYVTFGSFNNLTKVSNNVIQLWCEVLDVVPDSRLLLKWRSLASRTERERILRKFVDAGLDPGWLELRGAVPYRELLQEYRDVDIALDPFPFTGGLTSCDALWQGVPVITLPGDRPSSRQTLGFLMAMGLDGCAADSSAGYVRIAREMAGNLERLARLRSEIRPRMAASVLCDTQRFVHNLEAVYREMWQGWLGSTLHYFVDHCQIDAVTREVTLM